MNPERYLALAARYAQEIDLMQEYRFAAIGIRKDRALVHATNKAVRVATQRRGISLRVPLSHAEVRLCRKLGEGAIAFVARVLANNEWAPAKPCPNCERCLAQRGVVRVFYTMGRHQYGSIKL